MRTVSLAVVFAAALAACSRPESAPEPVRAVRTIEVGADAVATTQEYAAEIRARTESKLGFRVGGKLLRREVDIGD
ncbi:MAG: efflux RND transporter periplasmic adaptor subunit, partial [Burkholderiaceae bacterium]|nr:efflux RND transporter periplasmic adaptor subunit [Burkholderiaceae bacterium]